MRPLQEYIDELRSLDQHNIGSWPNWAYGFAIAVVSLLILLIASWYFVLPKHRELKEAKHTEQKLKQSFKQKQARVANLGAYRDQLAAINAEFGSLLAQLPSKSQVPSLLNDISQTRAENGLDEDLFKPAPEIDKGFYAVLPNHLTVTGTYHDFGTFVSDVAALSRIVTISDVHIEPVNNGRTGSGKAGGKGPLRMSLTASTYRYLGNKGSKGRS